MIDIVFIMLGLALVTALYIFVMKLIDNIDLNVLFAKYQPNKFEIVDVDEGVRDFTLMVVFKDGHSGEIDFRELIATSDKYKVLNTQDRFVAFALQHGTLYWTDDLYVSSLWIRNNLK